MTYEWLHFTQGETQPRSFRRKATRARIKPGFSFSARGSYHGITLPLRRSKTGERITQCFSETHNLLSLCKPDFPGHDGMRDLSDRC